MEYNNKFKFYLIIFLFVIFMLIHIELVLSDSVAPETILINVETPTGGPELGATCSADITSNSVNVENKPLTELTSLYDFIDPATFFTNREKGYYLLETGFDNYKGQFEIRVVCYAESFRGVSYTIINNNNADCEFKQDGKLLVC